MSLVATWCHCSDGKWYRNPVWSGDPDQDGLATWFVCLDDDEPPELVVQIAYSTRLGKVLDTIPWFEQKTDFDHRAGGVGREFRDREHGWHCRPAMRCFGRLIARPTVPTSYDRCQETISKRGEYCFYDLPERTQNV